MSYQLWLADVAREAGLVVKEVDGWQTRGKEDFNPEGTVCHHTGGGDGEMPSLRTLLNGRSDLPPPLANYGLGRSGTVYVVAAGRANHAGVGEWKGLKGNIHFIGIEAENKGGAGDPWPAVQLDAYYRLCAAIQKKLRRDAGYVCGHKEYALPPGRKNDPHTLNMNDFRQKVAALMLGQSIPEGDEEMRQIFYRVSVDANNSQTAPGDQAIWVTTDTVTTRVVSGPAWVHAKNLGWWDESKISFIPQDIHNWLVSNTPLSLNALVTILDAIKNKVDEAGGGITSADIDAIAKAVLDEERQRLES